MSHVVLPNIASGINGIGNLTMVQPDLSGSVVSSDVQSIAQQSMNALYFLSSSMFSPTGSLTINNSQVTVNSSEQVTFNADVIFAEGFVVDDSVLFTEGVTIEGSVPTLIENATTCSLGLAVTGQALTVGSTVGVVTEADGRLYTSGNAQIGGDLTVNGSQTVINGTLDAESSAHVLGGLTTDTLSVTSQADVTGSLTVTGTSTLNNVTVIGTLTANYPNPATFEQIIVTAGLSIAGPVISGDGSAGFTLVNAATYSVATSDVDIYAVGSHNTIFTLPAGSGLLGFKFDIWTAGETCSVNSASTINGSSGGTLGTNYQKYSFINIGTNSWRMSPAS